VPVTFLKQNLLSARRLICETHLAPDDLDGAPGAPLQAPTSSR
jgi:hypothetical protein